MFLVTRSVQLFILMILIFSSCKEKNDLYPPLPWGEYFYDSKGISPRSISFILCENDHSVWLGAQGREGILHHNGHEWIAYDLSNTAIPFDSITCMLRDGNGTLWVSWKEGLATFDGTDWQSVRELEGLCVTSLALQGIGIIWAGIDGDRNTGGIGRFENNRWKFLTPDNSAILSSRVTCLVSDHDQVLWVGTSDKGVLTFDGNTWTEPLTGNPAFLTAKINTLAMNHEGDVWAGTNRSQVIRLMRDNPAFLLTGTGKPVSCMIFRNDGSLWMGTAGTGLLSFNKGAWECFKSENVHFPGDSILSLSNDPNGRLLMSFPGGHVLTFK
jgi:ligand-binding sensor domain-containing protein